jgi:predicted DNA binding protein
MLKAVLRVGLPCTWVAELTREYGATVNILEQKPLAGNVLESLVEIDPGTAELGVILDRLRRNRYIDNVDASAPARGKILATLKVRECHACFALAESGCFLTAATATEEGGLEWHVVSPDRSAIDRLVRTLRGRQLPIDLASIHTLGAPHMLTSRQDRVLSLAYKLGYFEFPKKISLTALAKKLSISKSTLSEILRLGEQKVLHSYFQRLLERSP